MQYGKKRQRACKPGSVYAFRRCAAIPLGIWLPISSSNQPGRRSGGNPYAVPIRFCSRWGLPSRCCYQKRGALLPHHFDLTTSKCGGMVSVALSLKSPSPGVTRHRSSLEPGLSYPAPIKRQRRPPGPLACHSIAGPASYSKRSAHRIARHCPSITPSTFSGRKRRWNAITALGPSAMP